MEKREYYFVSRKNALTWISAVLMLCSTVARIALFCGRGTNSGAEMWLQVFLPVVAGVIFILLILLCGETHFYRTAVPVWLFAIAFGIKASMTVNYLRYIFLLWVLYIAGSVLYTVVTAGKVKWFWVLWFLTAALTAVLVYERRGALTSAGSFLDWCAALQNILMAASFFVISLAIDGRPDGYPYCPTWGDRSDGRRIRSMEAMNYVVPYFMPTRVGASNSIYGTIDLSTTDKYIALKRLEGLAGFGMLHVVLAAYVRVVARYPVVNRFCSGQHVYSRGDNIEVVMAVKTKMTAEAPETMIKVHFKPTDTATDVYNKLNEKILEVKDSPLDSDFDKTAKIFTYIPGVLLAFAVKMIRLLDYFGLLPKTLLEISPFHGSAIITSMASLGIPPIVHHLYDFGNLPVFVALGQRYRKNEVQSDGTVVKKKFVDFSVNTDERICDGFAFAQFLRYFNKLMDHPEVLDEVPEKVEHDIP